MHGLRNALAWLLGYRGLPLMSRPSFRYEIISTLFLGLGSGALAQSFIQLFARKSLMADGMLIAGLQSLFAVGNLFGVFLGPYLRRRRRIPYVVGCRLLIGVTMALVAFLPAAPSSALPYLLLLAAPSFLSAVVLNILPSVWQSNYPTAIRGQVFSRRYIILMATVALSVSMAGKALDTWAWAHRMIYPLAALCMLASAYYYAKIRVRGEPRLLRTQVANRTGLLDGFKLLRKDPDYARFMGWQMVSGSAVLMTAPVIIMLMTDRMGASYTRGTTALVLVPFLLSLVGAPFFGRLFDRVGITRFRALGASLWATSRLVLLTGLAMRSWPLILLATGIQGVAQSTGGVAFTIGHTHFSRARDSQVYMGIHMSLQGLRGLTMPFIGVALYGAPLVGGLRLLAVCAAIQYVGALGFALSPPPGKR
jgi:hypothetical protein